MFCRNGRTTVCRIRQKLPDSATRRSARGKLLSNFLSQAGKTSIKLPRPGPQNFHQTSPKSRETSTAHVGVRLVPGSTTQNRAEPHSIAANSTQHNSTTSTPPSHLTTTTTNNNLNNTNHNTTTNNTNNTKDNNNTNNTTPPTTTHHYRQQKQQEPQEHHHHHHHHQR